MSSFMPELIMKNAADRAIREMCVDVCIRAIEECSRIYGFDSSEAIEKLDLKSLCVVSSDSDTVKNDKDKNVKKNDVDEDEQQVVVKKYIKGVEYYIFAYNNKVSVHDKDSLDIIGMYVNGEIVFNSDCNEDVNKVKDEDVNKVKDEDEDEEVTVTVKQIIVEGVEYYMDINSNEVYDKDTADIIGMYINDELVFNSWD